MVFLKVKDNYINLNQIVYFSEADIEDMTELILVDGRSMLINKTLEEFKEYLVEYNIPVI